MKLSVEMIQNRWCAADPEMGWREGTIATMEVRPPISVGEDFDRCQPDLVDEIVHVFSTRKATILQVRVPKECYTVSSRGRLSGIEIPIIVKDLNPGQTGNRTKSPPMRDIAHMIQARLNDPSSF